MDCRTSALLALTLLTACVGCNATRLSQNPGLAWFKKSTPAIAAKGARPVPPPAPEPTKEETASIFNLSKSEPKTGRKPKPATCIAWGNFRERAAKLSDSDAEKQRLLDEARKAYQQALDAEPKNLQALAGLARVYTEMGKDDRALETFAKAVKDHPKEAGVWFTLGEHYKLRKEWGEAAKSYYQAHKIDPENRKYMQWLGFSLASAEQYDEAFNWLAKANGPATAHYNLAQLCKQKGNEDLSKKHLQQALQINPGHAEATAMLERMSAPAPQQTLPPAIPDPTPATASLPPTLPSTSMPPATLTANPAPSAATTAALPPAPAPAAPVAQIGFSPDALDALPPELPK